MHFENKKLPKILSGASANLGRMLAKKHLKKMHLKSVVSVYGIIAITSSGESLYNRHFIAKGIIRVQDIVDQNGLLLLWSDAQEKYSLNNSLILNWQVLMKNIPKKWKSMLSNDHIELLAAEGNGPTANKMSATTGIAYLILVKNIVKPQTAKRSLNNLMRLNSVDWTKVYMILGQVTIESSLRSF